MPYAEMCPAQVNPDQISLGKTLTVTFNGTAFKLPWVDKSTPDGPTVLIAFFDPLKHLEMGEAAACDMARILEHLNPDILVSPPSQRSIPMVEAAVKKYNQATGKNARLITLVGGYEKSDAAGDKGVNYTTEYSPITAHGKTKYLGVPVEQSDQVQAALWAGKKVVIIDDVYSTGATYEAIKTLLELPPDTPMVAAIYEQAYVNGMPEGECPPHLFAVVHDHAWITTNETP